MGSKGHEGTFLLLAIVNLSHDFGIHSMLMSVMNRFSHYQHYCLGEGGGDPEVTGDNNTNRLVNGVNI